MMPGIKGMKTLVATPSKMEDDGTKSENNREFKLLLYDITMGYIQLPWWLRW